MAIPSDALNLTLDPDALTLDDLELFEDFKVKKLKAFMAKYSNWTAAQIGALTIAELRDTVAPALADAIRSAAVPKANKPG